VDRLARVVAFVAAPPVRPVHRGGRVGPALLLAQLFTGGRVEITQPRDPQTHQHLVHPGRGDAGAVLAVQLMGDQSRPDVAVSADPLDPGLEPGRCALRAAVWAGGPLDEPGLTVSLPTGVPLVQALPGDPGLGGDVGLGPSTIDTQAQPPLPFERQRGTTVRHEDLRGSTVWVPSAAPHLARRSSLHQDHRSRRVAIRRVTNLREWDTSSR